MKISKIDCFVLFLTYLCEILALHIIIHYDNIMSLIVSFILVGLFLLHFWLSFNSTILYLIQTVFVAGMLIYTITQGINDKTSIMILIYSINFVFHFLTILFIMILYPIGIKLLEFYQKTTIPNIWYKIKKSITK